MNDENITHAMYIKHLAETCIKYNPTFRPTLKRYVDNIDINHTVDDNEENDLLYYLWHTLDLFNRQPAKAAECLIEAVRPVTQVLGLAPIFEKLVTSLHNCASMLQLAKPLAQTGAGLYLIASAAFIINRYDADAVDLVCDTVANIWGSAIDTTSSKLARQQEISRILFGPAWESLYAGDLLEVEDIVKDVLLAEPPFVETKPPAAASISIPDSLQF